MNAVPPQPKIYHIAHVDRLPSIVASGGLLSDAVVQAQALGGTMIGMSHIKQRRLTELQLASHPGLFVGACVPFYFCPRSVMLYLIHRRNAELAYQGGQASIIHLQADLGAVVAWANAQPARWAFTLSNAGSTYFEDRNDLACLGEINWTAVQATNWSGGLKEGKQAEFLVEQRFPWHLIERIGVQSAFVYNQVANALPAQGHRPTVEVLPGWYY
ncbi:type II toxin-antitoxin system toxin DNA ADP-ribosyl transferase DarT [Dokdonella sp. MW10]|uniref:type II toxin-antitoxin system toxin DNA ADP-ribosyl transferase DarT n=1 Tax=Dokdonella sp. MW10 TaxID=2992926 RepID=UPI003F7D2409